VVEHNSRDKEQEMADLLKRALRPASPSPEFRERLRQRLAQEAQERARKPKPVWQTPWIWAPAAAAALGLILALVLVPLLSTATGTLVIRITDAPPGEREITELNITVTKIEVHRAGDTDGGNGGWITVVEGSYPFELLGLAGVEELIGSAEVPVGKYTQIRIMAVGDTAVVDGLELPLDLPSDSLKIVNPPEFEIVEDGVTGLTLDFDIQEDGSIVDNGSKIILRPTIKIKVTQED
jgi:hypothetical protein